MLFNNSKRDLNKEIILLKNFIPQRLADDVERAFVNTHMPWYTNGDVWGKEYINLGLCARPLRGCPPACGLP